MPRLARQRIDYLIETLKSYRDSPRPGADTAMSAAIAGASDADIVGARALRGVALAPQSQNAKVRVSMLSRGGAFGGVLGSSNAECAVNRVGTFGSVSNTLNTIASWRFICGK